MFDLRLLPVSLCYSVLCGLHLVLFLDYSFFLLCAFWCLHLGFFHFIFGLSASLKLSVFELGSLLCNSDTEKWMVCCFYPSELCGRFIILYSNSWEHTMVWLIICSCLFKNVPLCFAHMLHCSCSRRLTGFKLKPAAFKLSTSIFRK